MAPPEAEKPVDHTLNRRPSVSKGENTEISNDAARLMGKVVPKLLALSGFLTSSQQWATSPR